MRADRLLSVLMLLQSRGRMTARSLAEELEVSERTIYRDMEALGAAGVPVYAERGRDGGFALLERYRTDLTGLTPDEVRALFTLTAPAALDQLGISEEVRAAMLKLAAALPDRLRDDESAARRRIYLDPSPWEGEGYQVVPHLQTIYRALWEDRRLHVTFQWPATVRVKRTIDPYGLVAKGGEWHLVWAAGGRMGVNRLARMAVVRITSQRFDRPADFDLVAFWRRWWMSGDRTARPYRTTLRAAPQLVPLLAEALPAATILERSDPDRDGWTTAVVAFPPESGPAATYWRWGEP